MTSNEPQTTTHAIRADLVIRTQLTVGGSRYFPQDVRSLVTFFDNDPMKTPVEKFLAFANARDGKRTHCTTFFPLLVLKKEIWYDKQLYPSFNISEQSLFTGTLLTVADFVTTQKKLTLLIQESLTKAGLSPEQVLVNDKIQEGWADFTGKSPCDKDLTVAVWGPANQLDSNPQDFFRNALPQVLIERYNQTQLTWVVVDRHTGGILHATDSMPEAPDRKTPRFKDLFRPTAF